MQRWLNRSLYAMLLAGLLCAAWLLLKLTLPYTALKPGIDFLVTKVNIYHILPWRWSFYTHVFTALPALLAGLTQFSGYIMKRWPRVHRICGYIYVIDVLFITGPAALLMSWYANGGAAGQASFLLQSACWLLFTAIALQRVLKRKFISHGDWMLRSYALTLGAVMLRVYNALLMFAHSDMRPVDKYILIAWASWIPNLIVAEILIRNGFTKGLLKARKAKT